MRKTAEVVYESFTELTTGERARFFGLLAEKSCGGEAASYEDVFGHLKEATLTSREAAEYLDVSAATFQRHVSKGRIKPTSNVGRSHLFSACELKAFKRFLKGADKVTEKEAFAA